MTESTIGADEKPCACSPVPEHLWTTHYGAVDPATTIEYEPTCLRHGQPEHNAHTAETLRLHTAALHRISRTNDELRGEVERASDFCARPAGACLGDGGQ